MPRTVTISEKPNYHPYACIQCGLGGPPREYFIDLGFTHQVFISDFNVYLCNECWPNLANSVSAEVSKWQLVHAAWDSPDAVYPTYDWEGTLNFESKEEVENDRPESGSISGQQSTDTEQTSDGTTLSVPGFGESDDRNDQDAEPNDSESEHPDSVDATTNDDSDDDATAKQVFTAFFGEQQPTVG